MPAGASAPLPSPEPVKTYQPGDSYRVSSGDGLWEIALKTRPDPGITRDQMMQALFRANPQAFSKAGINGPVSYTHLDVYKRQCDGRIGG